MTLFVENARLNNLTGLLKPNPYTEVDILSQAVFTKKIIKISNLNSNHR